MPLNNSYDEQAVIQAIASALETFYGTYVATQSPEFISAFKTISNQYKITLSKDVKANINNHVNTIGLNMFVHNPQVIASDATVFMSMQVFAPMLNFIYDILLIEK